MIHFISKIRNTLSSIIYYAIYVLRIKAALEDKYIDFAHFFKDFLSTFIEILTVMNVQLMSSLFNIIIDNLRFNLTVMY